MEKPAVKFAYVVGAMSREGGALFSGLGAIIKERRIPRPISPPPVRRNSKAA